MRKTGVHIYSSAPQSQHFCVKEVSMCSVDATVEQRCPYGVPAMKHEMLQPRNVTEWGVSHGEGGEITIFRIVLKMGPWAAGTTGMYCA